MEETLIFLLQFSNQLKVFFISNFKVLKFSEANCVVTTFHWSEWDQLKWRQSIKKLPSHVELWQFCWRWTYFNSCTDRPHVIGFPSENERLLYLVPDNYLINRLFRRSHIIYSDCAMHTEKCNIYSKQYDGKGKQLGVLRSFFSRYLMFGSTKL